MAGIAAEVGTNRPDELPAGPGTPLADFTSRTFDPVGQVLVVNAGIAQIEIIRGPGDDPGDRRVGQRPALNDGIFSGDSREQGTIDRKEAAGRCGVQPEMLSVFEATQVEGRSPVGSALVQVPPIQCTSGWRQIRAGLGPFHR